MTDDIVQFWKVLYRMYTDNPRKHYKYYQTFCRYHREEVHYSNEHVESST